MKEIIQHEKYGVIEFSEGSFLGNRSISINGQQLTKQSNKLFYIADGTAVRVVGGVFLQSSLILTVILFKSQKRLNGMKLQSIYLVLLSSLYGAAVSRFAQFYR